ITPPLTTTTSFWVRATNSCGSTDSRTAIVTIACNNPVITNQPSNASVNVGQSPTLVVVAPGAETNQWVVGRSGGESNPIIGATGPVLNNFPLQSVGTTSIWVKVTNRCGSTNSNAAIVTVGCAPTKPILRVPPTAPSGKTFLIFVSTPTGRTVNAEIQESLSSDFTTGLKTYNITDGTSQTILIAEKSKDTRVYYRARTTVPCSAQPSAFSDTISVLATAPLPPNLPSYTFAQPPCLTSPCLITQLIHIDGFNTLSKTGALATDQFTVSSDKPWITVSPSGGSLPAGGADLT